jgi:hypothetical protein
MQRIKELRRPLEEVDRRSLLKKDLTGPTLLEMSGLRVNQALRATDSATCEAISLARHVVSLTYVRRAT